MIQRRTYIAALLLMLLTTKASGQQKLYICQGAHCDAIEANNYNRLRFIDGDSLRAGMRPAYAIADIDSMTFRAPLLITRERGWREDAAGGQLSYSDHLTFPKDLFSFDLLFSISVKDGVCTAATCEMVFDEPWMIEAFVDPDHNGGEASTSGYIYVKLTQTGPRRYDVWTMKERWSIWPQDCPFDINDTTVTANCSSHLAGRPVGEVVEIVEAWIYEEGVKQDYSNE